MEYLQEERFELEKDKITQSRVEFIFYLLLSITWVWLLAELRDNDGTGLTTLSVCLAMSVGFTIFQFIKIRKIPYLNVNIDDDGLWYSHLSKAEGLIPWKAIYTIRERTILQRLDLLNMDGKNVMQINYNLDNFDKLRTILIEAKAANLSAILLPATFSQNMFYYLRPLFAATGIACIIAGLLWFAFIGYAGNNIEWYRHIMSFLLITAIMVIILLLSLFAFFVSVYKVKVDEKGIEIYYPFRSKLISYKNIESIDLADNVGRGPKHPQVKILTSANNSYYLERLGIDANELYSVLQQAWMSR